MYNLLNNPRYSVHDLNGKREKVRKTQRRFNALYLVDLALKNINKLLSSYLKNFNKNTVYLKKRIHSVSIFPCNQTELC